MGNLLIILKKIIFIFILSGIVLLFYACNKNEAPPSSSGSSGNTTNNTDSFSFETSQTVDVSVQIQSSALTPTPRVIKIYDNNPGTTGQLISTGLTDATLNYTSKVRIPTALDTVWIENQTVSNNVDIIREYKKVAVVTKKINYTFASLVPGGVHKAAQYNDPGCTTGCTKSITTAVSSFQIPNGGQVCLTASFNGSISFISTKSTTKLIVCGNDTINSLQSTGSGSLNIIVTQSGKLTLRTFSMSKVNITNYGTLNVTGGLTITKGLTVNNYGTANLTVLTNTEGNFNNYGVCNIYKSLMNGGTLLNQNLIQLNGNFTNNPASTFTNECKMDVLGSFQQNGIINNSGYILVFGDAQLNSNSTTNIFPQSNIEISNPSPSVKGELAIYGNVIGSTKGCGKITVNGNTNIYTSAIFTNQLDICDADGIEKSEIPLPSNVTLCKCFIPQSVCTPTSGTNALLDSDGDGVPDILDDFPNDATRAFTSYYPNIGTYGSLCFVDVWPALGDQAFNSLVVDFHYKIITNAKNEVVDIYGSFQPRAEGAGVDNSFLVALPVPPQNVDLIERTSTAVATPGIFDMNQIGYENGQLNNTVLLVVSSVYKYFNSQYYINVFTNTAFYQTDPITMHVQFKRPIPSTQLIPPYNPFLVAHQKRGVEVHMMNTPPTELATLSLFGTADDRSVLTKGVYYCSSTNLPWVLEIPEKFDYPVALKQLAIAYNKYSEWASSKGTKYKDWYKNKTGYRNATYVYIKK
ncbi:MAG: LruC domain-containing protein [Bacteroidetes bacterium]|nr:LruC domain-containing protein [Bacteroidota bacterium]